MEAVMNPPQPQAQVGNRRQQQQPQQQQPQHGGQGRQAPPPAQQHQQRQQVHVAPQVSMGGYGYAEAYPVYYTNVQYQYPMADLNAEIEEALSVHSVPSVESDHADPPYVDGTNGVPVGNPSPSYDPTQSNVPSSPVPGSSGTQSGSAGQGVYIAPAVAGPSTAPAPAAQINIQSGSQARVQVNTQQSTPPGQIKSYSTTVAPPGMKVLRKKDQKAEERETRKKAKTTE